MKTSEERYCDMIDALRSFDNGFHVPIVKEIEPYVDELIESARLTIYTMCNSCPALVKSECKDFSGCYCLKAMNDLIDKM